MIFWRLGSPAKRRRSLLGESQIAHGGPGLAIAGFEIGSKLLAAEVLSDPVVGFQRFLPVLGSHHAEERIVPEAEGNRADSLRGKHGAPACLGHLYALLPHRRHICE